MIKIYLPKNNNLYEDINTKILKEICNILYGVEEYTSIEENRPSGRYIKIYNSIEDEINYVCFSNPNNDSRNSRLMQFVSPTYVEFYKDSHKNKKLSIYLINETEKDTNSYINLFYRCFLTIGINLLNKNNIELLKPIVSYEDLKMIRKQTSDKNSGNKSTYFTEDENEISIFGKTFGANSMESFLLALTIKKLVSKTINFYPVQENESQDIAKEQKNLLINEGIIFGDTITTLPEGTAKPTENSSRDQKVFKYNLLVKYGDKKCYLCGCDIEKIIIASHIERITDIDNNNQYSKTEKSKRATDADNGFWLCANHDKMFENGIIFFNGKFLNINKNFLSENQTKFINDSFYDKNQLVNPFEILPEHFNENINEYLKKHLLRNNLSL